MEKRHRIGLDADGVIVDWQSNVVRLMNRRGHALKVEDWNEWNWLKTQVSEEDWKWLWSKGMVESYYSAKPYPGAEKFVKDLDKLGDIIILTTRPRGTWHETIDWWWKYMGFTPSGFNFFEPKVGNKSLVRCDFYIDDKPENCENEASTGGYVFLLDRPWNTKYNTFTPNIYRVGGYNEILGRINSEVTV